MALAIAVCLILSVDHKWAPSHLKEFEDLTDPST